MGLGPVELLIEAYEREVERNEAQILAMAELQARGLWCDEHACAKDACRDAHDCAWEYDHARKTWVCTTCQEDLGDASSDDLDPLIVAHLQRQTERILRAMLGGGGL